MPRRTLLATAGAVVAAPVLTGCGGGESRPDNREPDRVTYLTTVGNTAREAAALVASELGYFAEQHIQASIQPGAGGANNHAALASGEAHFAGVDAIAAMSRYANGEDQTFQIVAAMHQQSATALLAFADSGIRRPRDLNGRTVGLLAGTTAEQVWPTYADLQPGVDPDTVEIVPLSPGDLVSGLVSGQLDAISQFVAAVPQVQAAGGGREVVALPWAEVLPDLFGNVLITTKDLAQTDPDLVRRFITALMRGLRYMVEHPAEAAAIHHEHFPEGDLDAHEQEIRLLTPYVVGDLDLNQLGHIDQVRVSRAMALLSSVGVITTDFNDSLATPGGEQTGSVINFDLVPGGQNP